MILKISLNYSRKDFEEIYFVNNNENYFKSYVTKSYFNFLLFVTIGFVALTTICLYTDDYWGFWFIFSIVFIFSFIQFIFYALKIFKWKRRIKNYLDNLEKHNIYELIITDNSLTTKFDDNEVIEKWSRFSKAEINNQYISLIGEDSYIFPSKSMKPFEYEKLKEIISEKLSITS